MTEPLALTRADRVLVLAPHPDDETLATGGLLQRALAAGAETRVVFVTDGENNPWAQRAAERRWRIGAADRERWGERRRGEALAALACLGIPALRAAFLGFPDQGLQRLLLDGNEALIETLIAELERFHPTFLAAPAPDDLHPDHGALAVLARLALARLESRARHAGPTTRDTRAWIRPREGLYVVHHHGPLQDAGPLLGLALTPAERERKRRAILCHASQLLLRREALLAHAGPHELFFIPGPPRAEHPSHGIRRVRLEGGILHLELVRSSRLGAFGATDLLLALERSAAGPERDGGHEVGPGPARMADSAHPAMAAPGRRVLAARLPRRPGPVELFDLATGSLAARGEYRRAIANRFRGEERPAARVALPASLVAGCAHAFAKLERRFGFFDESGWRALPCGTPARRPAPPPPVPVELVISAAPLLPSEEEAVLEGAAPAADTPLPDLQNQELTDP